MSKLFGVDIKAIVGKSFIGKVNTGTITKITKGLHDPDNLTAGRTDLQEEYTFDGVVTDYNEAQINGTTIIAGDRKVLIIAASLPDTVIPSPNDKITVDGRDYKTVLVKSDPAGATYELQVRK